LALTNGKAKRAPRVIVSPPPPSFQGEICQSLNQIFEAILANLLLLLKNWDDGGGFLGNQMAICTGPFSTDLSAVLGVALRRYTKHCHLKLILLAFWFCAFPPHIIPKGDESRGSLGKALSWHWSCSKQSCSICSACASWLPWSSPQGWKQCKPSSSICLLEGRATCLSHLQSRVQMP